MKKWDDGYNDPGFQKHYARVMIAAARNSRMRNHEEEGWTPTLLDWAGKARRRAQQLTPRDLFGTAS